MCFIHVVVVDVHSANGQVVNRDELGLDPKFNLSKHVNYRSCIIYLYFWPNNLWTGDLPPCGCMSTKWMGMLVT